jgi:hypothetical protein
MTRQQFNNRLLKLAAILDKVPPGKFNMAYLGNEVEQERLNTCNTPACAAGWARTDPQLRKLINRNHDPCDCRSVSLMKTFKISEDQCERLFAMNSNSLHITQVSPKVKARQIRKMVAKELQ